MLINGEMNRVGLGNCVAREVRITPLSKGPVWKSYDLLKYTVSHQHTLSTKEEKLKYFP